MPSLVMRRAEEVASPLHRRSTDDETLLVVDDSPENLLQLGELLAEAGYHVRVANCGRVALQLAAQSP